MTFPNYRKQVWGKFDRTAAFSSRPLSPSDTQIDYVVTNIQNRPIYSKAYLRSFERDTVGNFVAKVIETLRDDEALWHEFGIQGRVAFNDRANPGVRVQSAAQSDDPRIGGEYLDVLRDISENFRHGPRASVSTRAQLTRPLKAVSVIKNRIRYLLLPHPRRATDRAAASATIARQPWEAKGHEPAKTIKRLLGKTDILRDHTAPLPASAAWSTEDLWIKHAPAGNLTVVSDTPSDRRSSHASSVVNLPEIEISDSNSCTTSIAFKRKWAFTTGLGTYRDNTSLSVDSKPRVAYWYHGKLMAQMMILGWSGTRF
ncbi:hypothetical protein CBS76997_10187 [Aspergillus niger]|nr:hypothetical protein CBS147323_9264 [Aspergillus niger]KAI3036227.1 hypothetical protein CBS76997_10187 [Aspergillus niger]